MVTRAAVTALGLLLGVTARCGGSDSAATAVRSTASSLPTAAAGPRCPSSAGLGTTVNDHGASSATGGAVALEAADFFFAPTCVIDLPTGTVNVVVRNTGRILHNISLADQAIDADVDPGQAVTVQVKIGRAPLAFVCKYHRTAGMVGALTPAAGP